MYRRRKKHRYMSRLSITAMALIMAVFSGYAFHTENADVRETESRSEETDSRQAYGRKPAIKDTKGYTDPDMPDGFSFNDIPEWDGGTAYTKVNDDIPYFMKKELGNTRSYEKYGTPDSIGRCTSASACIGTDLMPEKTRGRIGMIKPTGWHTVKYAGIDGSYLYNRCHLIGYQLTGENANEKNLITGTRYLNVDGMLPFEDETADYLHENPKNHVLYRVTPYFAGDELLARGVLMEAESIEDKGRGVRFCVFCYNVQPGITIDYSDGSSGGPEYKGTSSVKQSKGSAMDRLLEMADVAYEDTSENDRHDYVINRETRFFHRPSCKDVKYMAYQSRDIVNVSPTRIEAFGYLPCDRCHPAA